MNLFYDFETTGFPDWKAPSGADHQPHIVQAAAVLADPDSGEVISSFDLIARPDGWDIPEEVSEIHGITTEIALERGVPEELIVQLFFRMWLKCDQRIAHNESFDARIMRIALKRFNDFGPNADDAWKDGAKFCTCNSAKPLVKCPPTEKMIAAGRGKSFKPPNLGEAYLAATGLKFENAHSAMPDVLACKTVYEWVKSQ